MSEFVFDGVKPHVKDYVKQLVAMADNEPDLVVIQPMNDDGRGVAANLFDHYRYIGGFSKSLTRPGRWYMVWAPCEE